MIENCTTVLEIKLYQLETLDMTNVCKV